MEEKMIAIPQSVFDQLFGLFSFVWTEMVTVDIDDDNLIGLPTDHDQTMTDICEQIDNNEWIIANRPDRLRG